MLHRLESKNQDDQFQEIDEADMQGAPDEYFHSQWKSATPFFNNTSTPVLPPRPSPYAVSEVPNAPRTQQPIEQEIDTEFEIEMIKRELVKIHELQHVFSMACAQQPPPARPKMQESTAASVPTINAQPPTMQDSTAAIVPVINTLLEEIKHMRNSDKVQLKTFKDINDDVTVNFAVQDWESTFERQRRSPNVADVLDKIQQGG